uniref:Reverse transcriptase domain-containing protein n=1 Tax=Tanacetum cinerariifolium TaxID=118510 RepID=A0A6L2NTW4_TANCI|nr:reverse transcriptase domain-containing protein [Tanacetum cinerariifolium]
MADNRTMKELLQAPTEGYEEAIVIPKINSDHFEIKTNLLQLVQANPYHGFERDNPHTHINNFKRITLTLKYRYVPNDVIKLMMFPYSLEGSARIGFHRHESQTPYPYHEGKDIIDEYYHKLIQVWFAHRIHEIREYVCIEGGLDLVNPDIRLTMLNLGLVGGMWDRRISIGQTSNENLGLSTLEPLIELIIEHCTGKCNRIIGSEMVRTNDSGSTVNEYLTKIKSDSGPGIVKPLFEENIKFELWGQCIEELKENLFYEKNDEDPHQHISNIIEIIDLFHSPDVARDQLRIFYHGLDTKTRLKLDFKGPIPQMTPTKGMEDIKELSAHSFSWYNEGDIKTENKDFQTVLNQIHYFEDNMNTMTIEVKMAQHKYETPMEGRISNLEETLNFFIKESRIKQKESENLVWGKVGIDKALADLGANISLIPYSMYARLDLGELKPTLLDMKEDHKIPIILGRPFLATSDAMIDVFNKKISFEVGNETITLDIEKSMKFSTPEDDECLSIDLIDNVVSELVKEILPSSILDSFLFEPILNF